MHVRVGVGVGEFWYVSVTVSASWVPNLRMMRQTMRPSMKTTMFATDMVDPVIGFDIPGKPRTTASTITSTMTPATSRMKEGMTGANAPQDLFEVESVILLHLERYRYANGILLCRNLGWYGWVTA